MVLDASRLLWSAVALLFAATVLVAWIKVGPTLGTQATVLVSSSPDCDLRRGPCAADFPSGGRVVFEISPRHIPAVEKLELRVQARGIDAERVEIDFAGVDMNMGYNRVALQATGPVRFSGAGMLPVCVRARMTWEAKVLLHTDRGLLAAAFPFDTFAPGREPVAALPERTIE